MDTRIEASIQATRIAEMHERAARSRLTAEGAEDVARGRAGHGLLVSLGGYFRRGAHGIGRLHRTG